MKKMVCFALVFAFSSFSWANRSEKIKQSIQKREKKELKREIAREKKKVRDEQSEEQKDL